RPETVRQKVAATHRLADNDEVAAQVAEDVLPAARRDVSPYYFPQAARHRNSPGKAPQQRAPERRTGPRPRCRSTRWITDETATGLRR
ncbi:hypothetical protein P3T39_007494, partial [Kitasatospora sp. GP82]|nr:hypothetical protein [Kitasatospora sp. GP82]